MVDYMLLLLAVQHLRCNSVHLYYRQSC